MKTLGDIEFFLLEKGYKFTQEHGTLISTETREMVAGSTRFKISYFNGYLLIAFLSESILSTLSTHFKTNGECEVLKYNDHVTELEEKYPELLQLMRDIRRFLSPNSVKFIRDKE